MSHPVELHSLTKTYGERTVVDRVSFHVGQGEIVGFLGPNGAGKTTTLRMIAGYLAPTSGQVTVAGHDVISSPTESAAAVGYAPERPALYESFDVLGYLHFVARAKRVRRADTTSQLDRVVSACRLEAVARSEVYKLSKGYRQRLGLAQALLGQPEVLLLDEPTSGLDPGQISETREVIRSFGHDHSVLLSTHILPEVTLLCDRIAILHHGQLLAIDSPAGLATAVGRANRVELQVAACELSDLKERLFDISGVIRVDVDDRQDPYTVNCAVDSSGNVEAAIARVVTSDWDLLGLRRHDPSLEDVFLHYVEGAA
ncbi:MAG: ABC transporter ATP-binding protein [Rhodospirillales bacterium]|nr:ABC transporter ATP-binding protein [Rhodospirillales bacterium]